MATLLLTGGRAPATLDLARLLHRAGHRIIGVEHRRWHVSRPSRAFHRWYTIPAPLADLDGFASGLRDVVRREVVDLVIPTCEEVFHVARVADTLTPWCRVFTESIEVLTELHSKFSFNRAAADLGLAVPETIRATNRAELLDAVAVGGHHLVLKPEYSRFATEVIVGPRTLREIAHAEPTQEQPWVIQERLVGRHICTFSVAHAGRVTAHSAYAAEITAAAAAAYFEHTDHGATAAWVERFVRERRLTGQLAFDFIDVAGRGALALECNPRITSGIHLFDDPMALAQAYLDPDAAPITPRVGNSAMLAVAVMLYGIPGVRSWRDAARVVRALVTSHDVLFSRHDPLPGLLQGVAVGHLGLLALRHGRTMTGVSTVDIEYDGRGDRT